MGLATNTKFLDDLAGHREFEKANVHTGFIDQHYDVSSTSFLFFSQFNILGLSIKSRVVRIYRIVMNELFSNNTYQKGNSFGFSVEIVFVALNHMKKKHEYLDP